MAGSGALLTAISFFVNDPYWFLVTGTVFVVIGIALFFVSRSGQ
jgi:type II secretory pathway component PulF